MAQSDLNQEEAKDQKINFKRNATMNDATSNNNSMAPNALVSRLKADSFHARSINEIKKED
jgi:hypothetical protein